MTTDTLEQAAPKTTAPAAPATELTVIERADLALGASQTKLDLLAMVAKSANIVEIKDTAGRTECHRAAMALADARIAIAKTGKAARDDAVKFGKAVIAAEAALISITQPEEARLLGLRNTWDEKVEAEKAAAAAAEQARVTGIMARIDEFRGIADLAVQCRTSAMVDRLIERAGMIEVNASFAEFEAQAASIKAGILARLGEIRDAKKAEEDERARVKAEQEAESAKLAAERAELARQQAEAAAAQAKAAADLQAAQDSHAARVKAEHEAQAAELQRQRDADAADLKRRQDAFAAEMAAKDAAMKAEREAQHAEAARLQAQALELIRQRSELESKPMHHAIEPSPTAIETVVSMLEDDSVEIIPATLLVAGAAELYAAITDGDAAYLPVTMAEPASEYDPSDADVLQTALDALVMEYQLTPSEALARLTRAINAD